MSRARVASGRDLLRTMCLTVSREELERRLQEMVLSTTGEAGCARYDLHLDVDDAHRFVFVETWADQAAWAKHMRGQGRPV